VNEHPGHAAPSAFSAPPLLYSLSFNTRHRHRLPVLEHRPLRDYAPPKRLLRSMVHPRATRSFLLYPLLLFIYSLVRTSILPHRCSSADLVQHLPYLSGAAHWLHRPLLTTHATPPHTPAGALRLAAHRASTTAFTLRPRSAGRERGTWQFTSAADTPTFTSPIYCHLGTVL
jgi:hypothetical protein